MTNELVDLIFLKQFNALQLAPGAIHDFGVTAFGEDVDAPARELRSEAHVLSTTSDRLRKLVVRNDQLHAVCELVDVHPADLRWRDGVDNETGGVGMERNNVDRFAAEFLDNRLDPGALQADTCADRIDIPIHRGNGNLRAVTRLTSTRLDAHDPFVNLWYFELEQLHQ